MINTGNTQEIDELCQKIFNKDASSLKYLMVTNYVHTNLIENEHYLRSGLYSWMPVMDGEVKLFKDVDKDELEKYDIIQVNMSAQDLHLLGDIREILGNESNTKLVANNDYTLELWAKSFPYLSTLKREIQHADMIFGTEPYQVGALELLLGRKVHLVVHPAFVKRLKSLNKVDQGQYVSVVSHRYDNNNIVPSIATKGVNVKKRLLGYNPATDSMKHQTSICYDEILQSTNYMDFCEMLMESKVVYDPFSLTSQGRVGWDCAALGIPAVGSDRNESYRTCYPKTCCDPYDVKRANELIKRLLNDKEFRDEVVEYAKEAVERVSYENSKRLYFRALQEGSQKINEEK